VNICGLNVEVENPSNSPWIAGIYFGSQFRCFGSLVGTRYVLTAASCFMNSTSDPPAVDITTLPTVVVNMHLLPNTVNRSAEYNSESVF